MQGHRHHRQLGLVDQSGLESLNLHLSGDGGMIVTTLAQIEQMGACQVSAGGHVSVDLEPSSDIALHSWQLPVQGLSKWHEVVNILNVQHGLTRTATPNSIHLHFRSRKVWNETSSDLQVTVWNGRGVLSDFPLLFEEDPEINNTLIDASIEIAACAVALQQVLLQQGIIRSISANDRWLTLSVRIDDVPPEAAVDMFSSEYGPGTATALPDSSGSLLRFRVPLEYTPPEMLRILEHPCTESGTLIPNGWMSISPIPVEISDGIVSDHPAKLPAQLESLNAVVLGAGGLGSWAAPLLAKGVELANFDLTLIDGDDAVDEHNLNRQVLYKVSDIGFPKATQSAKRLASLFGDCSSIHGIHSRLESNHIFEPEDIHELDTVSLDSLFDDFSDTTSEQIKIALKKMDVGLACLDNMNSRTLFNRACIDRDAIFINGGGEAFEGLVEILDSNVCMTCRYGEESARSREVISCQEVGTRPVASIVTTTAWTGAMQAALALLASAERRELLSADWFKGLDFNMGRIQPRVIGRLPWIQGKCKSHA
ncbi:MAG: hypothetical protein CMB50_04410 [Euryarchaeota archaeon]|nr:hypothetical protein [Euryarchaeota archaeon]